MFMKWRLLIVDDDLLKSVLKFSIGGVRARKAVRIVTHRSTDFFSTDIAPWARPPTFVAVQSTKVSLFNRRARIIARFDRENKKKSRLFHQSISKKPNRADVYSKKLDTYGGFSVIFKQNLILFDFD